MCNKCCIPQENAGNDPLSQIVHGGAGGWQKPEPEQAPPQQIEGPSSLVGNSNWASREYTGPLEQPPLADNVVHYGARDRRLNPAEYPTLSAAAYAAQQHQAKQQQQHSRSGQVRDDQKFVLGLSSITSKNVLLNKLLDSRSQDSGMKTKGMVHLLSLAGRKSLKTGR